MNQQQKKYLYNLFTELCHFSNQLSKFKLFKISSSQILLQIHKIHPNNTNQIHISNFKDFLAHHNHNLTNNDINIYFKTIGKQEGGRLVDCEQEYFVLQQRLLNEVQQLIVRGQQNKRIQQMGKFLSDFYYCRIKIVSARYKIIQKIKKFKQKHLQNSKDTIKKLNIQQHDILQYLRINNIHINQTILLQLLLDTPKIFINSPKIKHKPRSPSIQYINNHFIYSKSNPFHQSNNINITIQPPYTTHTHFKPSQNQSINPQSLINKFNQFDQQQQQLIINARKSSQLIIKNAKLKDQNMINIEYIRQRRNRILQRIGNIGNIEMKGDKQLSKNNLKCNNIGDVNVSASSILYKIKNEDNNKEKNIFR